MKIIIFFLISLFGMFCYANGDDAVITKGFLSSNCGEYMIANNQKKSQDAGWSQGFLSGYNYTTNYKNGKQLNIPNRDTIILFTINFCQKNPLSTIDLVNWVLVEQLGGEPVQFKYNK